MIADAAPPVNVSRNPRSGRLERIPLSHQRIEAGCRNQANLLLDGRPRLLSYCGSRIKYRIGNSFLEID
jgi:hypothetical protein